MSLRAIILAAGQGSRLGHLTANRPKCMVELNGKPLLHHQIHTLERAGVSDIAVVCGYLADKVDALGHRKLFSERFAETNMVHTLFVAEQDFTDDLIVSYGDIVYSDKVLAAMLGSDAECSVAVDMGWRGYWEQRCDNPLDDAETLQLEGDRLISLGQRPTSFDDVQGQYIGFVRYRGAGVVNLRQAYYQALDAGGSNAWGSGRTLERAYMTDLVDYLCQTGPVRAVPIERGWVEIDNESDLRLAEIEAQAFLPGQPV